MTETKNKHCPEGEIKPSGSAKKSRQLYFLILELLLFGGLALYAFGHGLVSVVGAIALAIWFVILLLSLIITRSSD